MEDVYKKKQSEETVLAELQKSLNKTKQSVENSASRIARIIKQTVH